MTDLQGAGFLLKTGKSTFRNIFVPRMCRPGGCALIPGAAPTNFRLGKINGYSGNSQAGKDSRARRQILRFMSALPSCRDGFRHLRNELEEGLEISAP